MRLAVVAFLPRLGKDSKLLSTDKKEIDISRLVKRRDIRLIVSDFQTANAPLELYLYLVYATAAIIVIQTNFAFWYKLCECRPVRLPLRFPLPC